MNSQHLYAKASQLLDRATDEDEIMRGFYHGLARSYFRIASEVDRRNGVQDREAQQAEKSNEVLARLLLALSGSDSDAAAPSNADPAQN